MFDYKFIFISSFMRGAHFPIIYHCSKQKFCKVGMKMGMMKLFPFLLTFFRQLVLREAIFGTNASSILYFIINKL